MAPCQLTKRDNSPRLDVVNLDFLAAAGAPGVAVTIAVFIELEAAVPVLVGAKGVRLIDLGRIRQLTICLSVYIIRFYYEGVEGENGGLRTESELRRRST